MLNFPERSSHSFCIEAVLITMLWAFRRIFSVYLALCPADLFLVATSTPSFYCLKSTQLRTSWLSFDFLWSNRFSRFQVVKSAEHQGTTQIPLLCIHASTEGLTPWLPFRISAIWVGHLFVSRGVPGNVCRWGILVGCLTANAELAGFLYYVVVMEKCLRRYIIAPSTFLRTTLRSPYSLSSFNFLNFSHISLTSLLPTF